TEWKRLLESRIGLFIAPERRSFLAGGIRSRMRVTGCREYGEYYQRLSSGGPQAQEWSLLIDCLTVHETCFFRHESSMKLVEDVVLPAALEQEQSFHVWSVGCASGEEAYSLAMLVDACYSRQLGDRYFGVTGTDISLPSLHQARAGMYLNRRFRDIREAFQRKYCQKVTDRRFQIKADLRKRVCFSQLNLRDVKNAPFVNLSLIYCQNLLIYYEHERRLQIVNQLGGFLRPGGVLILGRGELLDWKHPDMEKMRYEDTLAYRRAD
ncbi:MAG: protein-glutamate O-methyltransferase CheR, partial [Pseudomonadota bacterium]|nr:protein-glutamate O-methyltransferase CheR [Pseudomonadota bacterium]